MCILCANNKQKENKKEDMDFFNYLFAQKISGASAATMLLCSITVGNYKVRG
jgi:hypothetical protein